MSLINYVEPANVANLGGLILACTMSYIIYRIYIKCIQWFDVVINKEAKHSILEESFLDKIGEAKGIDLDKELIKREMLKSKDKKSFRSKVEDQIYEDMFGKEKVVSEK